MTDQRRALLIRELHHLVATNIQSRTIQTHYSNDLIASIADALHDGTVFSIIDSLRDMQLITERNLYQSRQDKLIELQRSSTTNNIADEMRAVDRSIIDQLDQLTTQQQTILAQAGVPRFTVTNNPDEIRLQMSIIESIVNVRAKLATSLYFG
jgi:hypothetical protein